MIIEIDSYSFAAKDKQLDTGTSTSIMPQYIQHVLQLLSHKRVDVRMNALEVTELALRQGLFIPAMVKLLIFY